jgi:predicted permease
MYERGSIYMEILQPFRLAVRTLLRRPVFSVGVVLCLALAIGTGSALFLFIYGILLRPLPVADPDRLVWISSNPQEDNGFSSLSYPDLLDFQRKNAAFSGVTGYVGLNLNLRLGETPEAIRGQAVTSDYFKVLGVEPVLGRAFLPDGASGEATGFEAVLSYDLWKNRFGADPHILGKAIFLNEEPFTVVGVAPQKFKGTQFLSGSNGLWLPLGTLTRIAPGAPLESRQLRWLEVMGRLRPGVSLRQAQAAADNLALQLATAYPESNKGIRFTLYSTQYGHPTQRSSRISVSLALAGTALLVLLFACTNVTSLLLARNRARMKDMGLQVALGAVRGQIVRQLMTENLLLFLAAGVLALVLAAWTGRSLAGFRPTGLDIGLDFSLDGRVAATTLVLAVLPGLLFGLIPALQAARVQVAESLRGDSPSTTSLRRRFDWRTLLLGAQVAISMVLLISAGLLLRSVKLSQAVDLGFSHTDAILVPIDLQPVGYHGPRAETELRNILDHFEHLPEVRSAAMVLGPPLGGGGDSQGFYIEGHQPPRGRDTFSIEFTAVSPNYFSTLGIQLLKGRDFGFQDQATGPHVVIANQAFADRFWPGKNAVGQRIRNDSQTFEIVGVVATSKYHEPTEEPIPFLYLPLAQSSSSSAALVLYSGAPPATTVALVRRELLAINSKIAIAHVAPLSESINQRLLPARFGASLLSACGLLTLVLAAIGIYGSVAYAVATRRREIGIRMALGAQPGQILRLILGQNLMALWVGVILGIFLSVSISGLLRGFLYGIGPSDPQTYVGVLVFFTLITLAAAFFPAKRATAVSPAISLKHTQG